MNGCDDSSSGVLPQPAGRSAGDAVTRVCALLGVLTLGFGLLLDFGASRFRLGLNRSGLLRLFLLAAAPALSSAGRGFRFRVERISWSWHGLRQRLRRRGAGAGNPPAESEPARQVNRPDVALLVALLDAQHPGGEGPRG